VRVSTLAGAVAWLTFYAWSPPRLYGVPRPDTDVQEYLEHTGEVAFRHWTAYWGQLGWLDYNAGQAWYQGLLWIFIGASVLSFLRLPAWRRHASFALFAVLFGVAYFIGVFVGEFRYLAAAGFTFQGRYLLPASVAVAVVLLEQWRAWRLVVVVYLLALNVALVQRTVERYYDGSWSRLWSAQAFTRTSETGTAG
jgi:hypothetical protein